MRLHNVAGAEGFDLAAISSDQLECEQVRRRIDQGRVQITAIEFALAHMRLHQANREKELARQIARITANAQR